ncbi:MAG: penicillin-binding protein 2, penicillin-binding protein 2 [Candidatus Adlerbacteria bacterium]|nr:penicillin-binding protein 2, penicillin-binding protein 2 [Candidatus Adlerbacteria bacterium]
MLRWWFRKGKIRSEIHPDEILIDSQNVSDLDRDQFEGRIERPLSRRQLVGAGSVVAVAVLLLLVRAGSLQVVHGQTYAEQAKNNQLTEETIFADRGTIVDRNGIPLAWNERDEIGDDFARRAYASMRGLAHAVGYTKAPAKDSSGNYFRTEFEGLDGVEKAYNAELGGQNGLRLTETDALGNVVSEATTRAPAAGAELRLSIDAKVTQGLYDVLAKNAGAAGFQGAAGVIMDVRTGELLALTSYPEYSQTAMVEGDRDLIASYNTDKRQPFLDRAVDGLYAPGSIVKPIMAAGAISDGIIDEYKQILSTGSISIPNQYDPKNPTLFRDWRVNGWTDARHAIAVSSDVYFYSVGGGYQDQRGMGIATIDKWLQAFGYGQDAGLKGFSSKTGTIPTIDWKAKTFPDDPTWRLGNTYHTAIGQFGTQVTPLQAVRTAVALANSGTLLTPTLIASSTPQGQKIDIDPHALQVAREGMRLGVTEGIATGVKLPYVSVAAKTGTAQIGMKNEYWNAWMIGFWPYENPKYAFVMILDRAPAHTSTGGNVVMAQFFSWMHENAPEYLQ